MKFLQNLFKRSSDEDADEDDEDFGSEDFVSNDDGSDVDEGVSTDVIIDDDDDDDDNEEEKQELGNITKNITNSLPILIDKKLDLFSSTVNNK